MIKEFLDKIQISIVTFEDGEGLAITDFCKEGSKNLRLPGEQTILLMKGCPSSRSILLYKEDAIKLRNFLEKMGVYEE